MTKIVEAKSKKTDLNKANILGVNVAITREDEVISIVRSKMQGSGLNRPLNRPYFVVTVNPEFVMQAQGDDEFKMILNTADLAIPDGRGLRLAVPELEIVPGRKLVSKLIVEKDMRVFYLGGRAGVARQMAEKYGGEWDEGHTNIKIQDSRFKVQNKNILDKINKYKPDLLLVAYGAPWQEKWIYANLNNLQAKVAMGVGGTFDFLTGRAKLPPGWMEKAGLEWLWRLINEPARWRRQIKLVKYVWLVKFKGRS